MTEMEYQHLVFEEFARKVQPAINAFAGFAFTQTNINPAVKAEFAHAVYRFGHSMLTEDIARINEDGSTNDIPLLDGFLNPASYRNGGSAGTLSSQQAAGAVLDGHVRPGRQRARRVRDRDPAQQPAGSAARPSDDQHDPRTQRGHPTVEPASSADLRDDQRLPVEAVRRLDRLRPPPEAPGVADQLRRGLRHTPASPVCRRSPTSARQHASSWTPRWATHLRPTRRRS